MKKYLLILSIALAITANAQTPTNIKTANAKRPYNNYIYPESDQPSPLSPAVKKQLHRIPNPGNKITTNTIVVDPIGSAGNCFGSIRVNTQVWYDLNLNTVSFVHRSMTGVNGSTTIGDIRYDYSTDGGHTWPASQYDQGPVYKDTTNGGGTRGRYPHGAIYNPSGNTTVSGASMTVFGPITDGTIWQDVYEGTLPIGTTNRVQQLYSCAASQLQLIPDGFQIVKQTGTVWGSSENINSCGLAAPVFNDTVVLSKGTYNSTTHQMDYTFTQLSANMEMDANGGGYLWAGHNIAWNDNGNIGYIVMSGNDGSPGLNDSTYYPIIYKTENGGATWNKMNTPHTDKLPIPLLPTNPNDTCLLSDFQLDCVVDKNDNLHFVCALFPYEGSNSIEIGDSTWGIFDIYTKDGGANWYGKLLANPETFDATFSPGNTTTDPSVEQRSRPQATRSWDGSKLFFSWFDTDTVTYGAGNFNPDWHVIGYNVNTGMWTSDMNMTTGTDADGLCTFGDVSYYSMSNGSEECIPMTYGQMQSPTSTGEQLSFSYVDGACVDSSTYTVADNSVLLTPAVGITEHSPTGFSVSANYPNPFTGSTMVDVTLTKPTNVTIEVSDMLGQVLSTKTYNNLASGKNHLTINESDLAAGIYLYKVIVGTEMVAHTMAVK